MFAASGKHCMEELRMMLMCEPVSHESVLRM